MSSHMLVRAWQVTDLTPSQRLVLLALADCSDRDGCNAFRSISTIAAHTQLGYTTVKRALQVLAREKNLIVVQAPCSDHRPTTYRLFPIRGVERTPLGGSTGGAKSIVWGGANPSATLDPLIDPVDPVVQLTRTQVRGLLDEQPTLGGHELLDEVLRWWRGKQKVDPLVVGQAIELELESRRSASESPARAIA